MKSIYSFIKTEKIFFLFLILLHALYFIYALNYGNIYTNDTQEYLQSAYNLKAYGEVYNYFVSAKKLPEYYTLRPPLYGIFIVAIKLIYNSDFFVILIQNIISICIFLLSLFLINDLQYKLKMQYVIILTLVFFPTQLIVTNSIGADVLLELWLMLSLTFLVYYFRAKKIKYIIIYNLMLVLAVLTKPVMVYFWIPNLVFSIYLFSTRQNFVILLSALLLPLSIYTWCLRNENKTGFFHFSSIKIQNILDLNAGAVLTILKGEDEASIIKKNIINTGNQKETYKLKSEFIISESIKIIKEHPLIYSYTHAKGMLNFILSIGRYDMMIFCPTMSREEISIVREIETKGFNGITYYLSQVNIFLIVLMILILLWNIILLVSTLSFYFNGSIQLHIKLFMLIIIIYICFVCGSGGQARFKMCILPFMIVTVPFLIDTLTQKISFLKRYQTQEPSSVLL